MFIHQRTPTTFRVTEWPTSGAGHFRLFNQPKLRYDLSVILDFVADAIFNTNKAFVWHSTFSLVNVTSPIANLSFGFNREPYEPLRRFHPVSFTFAFTRRDRYGDARLRPRFMMSPFPYVTFWGYSQIGNSDFMTINIPKRVMREAGLLVPNMREMEWLYMAIGAFAKGFSKRFHFWNNKGSFSGENMSIEIMRSRFFHRKFQAILKHVPYDKWMCSRDMWMLAPNILSPRADSDNMMDYYCRYLAHDFYGEYTCPNVLKIESKAADYLESGVLDALPLVDSEIPNSFVSQNFETVLHMLGGNLNLIGHRTDVSGIVRDLLTGKLGGVR